MKVSLAFDDWKAGQVEPAAFELPLGPIVSEPDREWDEAGSSSTDRFLIMNAIAGAGLVAAVGCLWLPRRVSLAAVLVAMPLVGMVLSGALDYGRTLEDVGAGIFFVSSPAALCQALRVMSGRWRRLVPIALLLVAATEFVLFWVMLAFSWESLYVLYVQMR